MGHVPPEVGGESSGAPILLLSLAGPVQQLQGEADAVQRQRLTAAVDGPLEDRERTPAVGQGQLRLTEVSLVPADGVVRGRLPAEVAGTEMDRQGLLVLDQGVGVTVLAGRQPRQGAVNPGPRSFRVQGSRQHQGPREIGARRGEVSPSDPAATEVDEGPDFAPGVVEPPGGARRGHADPHQF